MCRPLRLQSGPWPLACREAMQFQFMDELWGDGQPAPAAEATHPDPAAGTIVIAAAGIDGRAAQQQRLEQWGHWRSLTAAQRELRGARLREGKPARSRRPPQGLHASRCGEEQCVILGVCLALMSMCL